MAEQMAAPADGSFDGLPSGVQVSWSAAEGASVTQAGLFTAAAAGDYDVTFTVTPEGGAPRSVTETITVGLMEIKKHALGTVYGHANVTDAGGVIEVKHNWGNADEHYQYVFLLLLKNDRAWTKYIPDGKVTELGDLTGNKTTAAMREVTITYLTDANGNGCFDWYDSTETHA